MFRVRSSASTRGLLSQATVQDLIGVATVGDGYVLRTDGIAVGLAELTPPDLRLYDEAALSVLLAAYEQVLRSSGERMSLHTYTVAPDPRPLLASIAAAHEQASDFTSYQTLRTLQAMLDAALRAQAALPSVRWILAVPSIKPEEPPAGTWGELYPSAIVGQLEPLPGDPIAEVLARTRRLVGALSGLGFEPPPRLLSAAEISALGWASLDPISAQLAPRTFTEPVPRLLPIHEVTR
jgi:hypothetical protein